MKKKEECSASRVKKKNTKSKTPQPKTKKKIQSKKPRHEWEDYFNAITTQMHPANNAFKLRFFSEMVQWATENDEAYHIYQYSDSKGVDPDTVNQWIHKDPKLKKLYEHAKRQIGFRREIGAMKRKLEVSTAQFTLPQYCSVWRKETERRADLKLKPEESQQPITVVIEPYEETPVSPKAVTDTKE